MDQQQRSQISRQLYQAWLDKTTIPPLTRLHPAITIEDAYGISIGILGHRLQAGEKVIGKKIGVTSAAVQTMLGVFEPDFGFLTDAMCYPNHCRMPISERLIQPRAEGEIAFVLKRSLRGPGLTEQDVLAATDYVSPCFEIVDSRIEHWQISIQDTIADNASCGLFLLGDDKVKPSAVDLVNCEMVVSKNGSVISTGIGAAALGSPLIAVAWLANTLGRFGVTLEQGDIILSGSLVPLEPVQAGDTMSLHIGNGIGSADVTFV
jgi:2-oxopent-4-enoate/cis-2-oxohex-4-enoate hydratase